MRFSWITSLAAPALAVLALTGAFYHGDRLSIDFPDGWTIAAPDKDGLVTATKPGDKANCNVQTRDLSALGNATLTDINAEYGHVFTVADWADLLGQKPEDLTLELSNISPFADAFYHTATFRMKASPTREVSVRYGFYVLPGRISMAGCYALSADYPAARAELEKVIASFRPW